MAGVTKNGESIKFKRQNMPHLIKFCMYAYVYVFLIKWEAIFGLAYLSPFVLQTWAWKQSNKQDEKLLLEEDFFHCIKYIVSS